MLISIRNVDIDRYQTQIKSALAFVWGKEKSEFSRIITLQIKIPKKNGLAKISVNERSFSSIVQNKIVILNVPIS
jgi:hypothetical protein